MAKRKKTLKKDGVKLENQHLGYVKMLKRIEQASQEAQEGIKSLDTRIAKLKAKQEAEMKALQDMRSNLARKAAGLVETKSGLEKVMSNDPPKQWVEFQKHVFEYHYHFHNHECPCNKPCPYPHSPIYVGPWWHYYQGGHWVHYPSITQLTGVTIPQSGNVSISLGNANSSSMPSFISNTVTVPAQPSAGGLMLTSNLSGGFSAGEGVNTVMFSNSVHDSTTFTQSMDALNNIGFFDNGVPNELKIRALPA